MVVEMVYELIPTSRQDEYDFWSESKEIKKAFPFKLHNHEENMKYNKWQTEPLP